ncbi:MAG: hypothetical protein M3Q62_06310 [Actinomycetota bacterium]|jgi:hypothetical protein|nr:hypothetical protein [Rubrobacteraceae bacterium]MDQ3183145.1 hypothetical protein [Actinomycetota bacterium]MDQ3499351.1 hypothetical protein [Actinomycetota bacterium]
MSFIMEFMSVASEDLEEGAALFQRYYEYLDSVKERMPQGAYSFAVADWHYDHDDPRCPHDAWVEALVVAELSSGTRSETRDLEVRVRLLGALHDGHIELTYTKVQSYLFETPRKLEHPMRPSKGHEDWMIDEVRLSESGYVLHEVEFSRGSRWVIESEDLIYRWKPFKD